MRISPLVVLVISASSLWAQSPSEKAAAATAILDAYHGEQPKPGDRNVHIVCWRPQDRDFAKGHRERLPRMLKHIQEFYRSEMERNSLGSRTFNLDARPDGALVIHEAIGSGNFADYGRPDGQRIKQECVPVLKKAGIDPERETVVIFTNLSTWDEAEKTFFHKSPYYAGGNHRAGTAWQLDSPELDTLNLDLKEPMIQDGEYGRISLGKHNSIFIGGIAHEMGHAFGLPHCRARRDEERAHGTALMGSGNRTYFDEVRGEGRGSFLTLAHALRLASHPQFSGSVKGMNLPTKTKFNDLALKVEASGFSIGGRLESSLPVYAVIGYLDPDGGGDYDSRTVVAIPDSEGRFSLDCEEFVAGKSAQLRLVACLVNGATATWRSGFKVNRDGSVDGSAMEIGLQLAGFLAALETRDYQRARALLTEATEPGRVRDIGESILAGIQGDRPMRLASEIPAQEKSIALSRIQPAEASVGWQRPAYDHVPRPDSLLISDGEIFETGIYAHAPARHRYELANGDWLRLKGKCGLPNQRGGSVVFVIKADGKEVFRSKKLEASRSQAFDIDIEGVQSLELMTEDAGDGPAVDWGFWFGPQLIRQ